MDEQERNDYRDVMSNPSDKSAAKRWISSLRRRGELESYPEKVIEHAAAQIRTYLCALAHDLFDPFPATEFLMLDDKIDTSDRDELTRFFEQPDMLWRKEERYALEVYQHHDTMCFLLPDGLYSFLNSYFSPVWNLTPIWKTKSHETTSYIKWGVQAREEIYRASLAQKAARLSTFPQMRIYDDEGRLCERKRLLAIKDIILHVNDEEWPGYLCLENEGVLSYRTRSPKNGRMGGLHSYVTSYAEFYDEAIAAIEKEMKKSHQEKPI